MAGAPRMAARTNLGLRSHLLSLFMIGVHEYEIRGVMYPDHGKSASAAAHLSRVTPSTQRTGYLDASPYGAFFIL
jgi:hypothetical protein